MIDKNYIKECYKALVIYREELRKEFLNGGIELSVYNKADMFHTTNAFERLLGGAKLTQHDAATIDQECAALGAVAELYPEQFVSVLPQLQAVGAAFEAVQAAIQAAQE